MRKEILRMQEVCAGRYEPGGLSHFQLHMKEGEMVGLYGYSGAGKTVLYEYFMGDIPLKSGKVVFDGRICPEGGRFPYAQLVLCLGSGSTLIPGLSVAENIFVINGKRKGWNLVWRPNIYYRARMLLGQYAPQLSPHTLARELTPAQMRLVELLRAIENEVKLVVIDDSFQGFGQSDMQILTDILAVLKKRRVAILFETLEIKLNYGIMDRIVLLRKGKNVRTFYEEDFDDTYCRKLLLGNEVLPSFQKHSAFTQRQRLQMRFGAYVAGCRGNDEGLTAREGEILGLYDMDNRRNVELLEQLLGAEPFEGEEILLDGEPYEPKGLEDALDHKIGYMLERMREISLVGTMDFADNLSLPILSRRWWRLFFRNRQVSEVLGAEYREQLQIPEEQLHTQVKYFDNYTRMGIFLQRWILFQPRLMVCIEPWANADMVMKDMIFRAFAEMTRGGTTILIASRNMNELRSICDSIYVLHAEGEGLARYENV